jgi:Ser/Thr protein kinase RdoA (MazF antagonist)
MEDGPPLIAKFYRPERWTNEAILEEHAFVQELVESEIPVIPALVREGKTLHTFEGFRFAIFPKHGGRAPEFEDRNTLEWMGRFLGRVHAIGSLKSFERRPTLDIDSFGLEPLNFLLHNHFIPSDLDDAYRSVAGQALGRCSYVVLNVPVVV